MALSWSEELSVGNALIDTEHKDLIVKVNELLQAISTKEHAALQLAFERLENYALTHFANEEKIARSINLPFGQNSTEHKHFLEALSRIKKAVTSMSARNGGWAEDAAEHYSVFLCDWFANHIIKEDMLMKPALQAYPYDFNFV